MSCPGEQRITCNEVRQCLEVVYEDVRNKALQCETSLTLVFADLSPIPLRDADAGEISTQDDNLGNEAVLHAIVEHLAQS